MNDKKDHTVLIAICVLIGIVLTISVAIIGSVYNNNQNISRDKFYAQHCKEASKINTDNGFTTGNLYECGN